MSWPKFPLNHPIVIARPVNYIRNILCILLFVTILKQCVSIWNDCALGHVSHTDSSYAANSTLGFGAIYAVSKTGSPRSQSLILAANLTGLHINIPSQPFWSDDQVRLLKSRTSSALDRGSALAWLGHLTALRAFLDSSSYTALIIEDDVDWDTLLRVEQMPRTGYAIRQFLDSPHDAAGYFGNIEKWDILWLGHCGDWFDAAHGSTMDDIKVFHDPARLKLSKLHPWTRDFVREIGLTGNNQRIVHWSVKPLCSFAYALTRQSATRLLNDIAASEYLRESKAQCSAYDIRLLEACRDEGLRCITVNPELFHHSDVGSEIARVSSNTTSVMSDISSSSREFTVNIRCSARSERWQELNVSNTVLIELAEARGDCYIRPL